MRRTKLDPEIIINAVNEYLTGGSSKEAIAKRLGVSSSSINCWVVNYQAMGESAFIGNGNRRYSKDLKEQAVRDYLSGKGSLQEVCKEHKIKSCRQLRNWIKVYNGHGELKTSGTGGTVIMTRGRKTSFDERVEIVQYCIANDHNYAETAARYGVSYQQIYSWVRKYEAKGVAGLTDRRGKAKPEDELTEADGLRMENKILQAKIKDQEMEIKLLKKLKELEGGDW